MAHREQLTTIAILGSDTLAELVLAHLLEDEGYAVRLLNAPPPKGSPTSLLEGSSVDESLEGVDMVLVWPAPSLREGAKEAFLGTMRSTLVTAAIPALDLPPSLEEALQDEIAVDVPLEQQFEHLVRRIETTLSTEAL